MERPKWLYQLNTKSDRIFCCDQRDGGDLYPYCKQWYLQQYSHYDGSNKSYTLFPYNFAGQCMWHR